MKPPDLPTLSEKYFETLPQWVKDYIVALCPTCERWKAFALRQEGEILELRAKIKDLREGIARRVEFVAQ